MNVGSGEISPSITHTAGRITVGGLLSAGQQTGSYLQSGGTLTGAGTLDADAIDIVGGTFEPGGIGSVGSMTFASIGPTFTAAATVEIQIGGATPGQFDQVLGAAFAGGSTLNLSLVGGYIPGPGEQLQIFDNISSTFSGINENDVINVGGYDFRVTYEGGGESVAFVLTSESTTHVVTNLNDSGAGSLRQAILDANASVGTTNTIDFSGLASGGVINLGARTSQDHGCGDHQWCHGPVRPPIRNWLEVMRC